MTPSRSGRADTHRHLRGPDKPEEDITVTVPEENRPKTTATDKAMESKDADREERQPGATGSSMREAMEEAGIRKDACEK